MSKYGLDLINKIKPCTFQYKQTNENGVIDDNNLIHFGCIAQELNELLPENEFALVKKMKDGYYLSVYTHISELACLLKIGLRDNHNMSLWKKEGSKVELLHYL